MVFTALTPLWEFPSSVGGLLWRPHSDPKREGGGLLPLLKHKYRLGEAVVFDGKLMHQVRSDLTTQSSHPGSCDLVIPWISQVDGILTKTSWIRFLSKRRSPSRAMACQRASSVFWRALASVQSRRGGGSTGLTSSKSSVTRLRTSTSRRPAQQDPNELDFLLTKSRGKRLRAPSTDIQIRRVRLFFSPFLRFGTDPVAEQVASLGLTSYAQWWKWSRSPLGRPRHIPIRQTSIPLNP